MKNDKNSKFSSMRPQNVKATLLRALGYLKPFTGKMIIVILLIVFHVGANVGGTVFLGEIVKKGLSPEENPTLLWMTFSSKTEYLVGAVLTLGFIYLLGVVANFFTNWILVKISTSTLYTIRTELFDHMQTLPIRFFDTNTHGELMSRYTNDVDALSDFVARSIPQFIQSGLQIIWVFVMMLVLSWKLTLCVVAMLVVMSFITKFFGSHAKTNFQRQQKAVGKVNGFVEEMVDGQKVIKVFNHESKTVQDFSAINEEWRIASTKANSYANMMMPIMGNVTHTFYIVIAVVGTLISVSAGKNIADATLAQTAMATALGSLASFLIFLRQISNPISQLSQQVNVIFMALAGSERIFSIMDMPSETDDGYVTLVNVCENEKGELVESVKRTGRWGWKHPHGDGTTTYVELKGAVEFDDVTFSYNPQKPALFDVTLYANPGQKIAFVGSTGAGKTTITNLINRFYDVPDGKIRYDGINVNKIKKADLRRSLGMVLQDTHLFTGTVMDNIRYGKLDATDEECIAAAKTANADFFITHLPDGYNTMLSGDGANLSQGQRQLIAIARAAVADPPVLILDEATSSIDTRTEWLIEKGMDKLMEGRTTFVIAHRLSTVRNSDAIMVLEKGRIIERGNHDALIAQKGKYYQLYTGMFELS